MAGLTFLELERSKYKRIARLALEEKQVEYVLRGTEIFSDGGGPVHYFV